MFEQAKLLDDVAYIFKSLQERVWNRDSLIEARELIDSLFSIAEKEND